MNVSIEQWDRSIQPQDPPQARTVPHRVSGSSDFRSHRHSRRRILCFTAERYIDICKPLLAQKMCTTKRAQKIIIATWLMGFLYSLPWLFLTGTNPHPGDPNMERCDYKLNRQ
ncbi:hypothetical protein RvY_10903 [Ramazzottius varieornatus]|uniref:Thyrotropin-releasing hormone receptor n=1 Tax=Ramazzottius varieornatus TaxID=947166 RepID=A0A1D1VE97_RAMVA|nr:hypothetical protein RvY_10903 [Ramazzottius varieornatus]